MQAVNEATIPYLSTLTRNFASISFSFLDYERLLKAHHTRSNVITFRRKMHRFVDVDRY